MVCPYNNFKPCNKELCPAFYTKRILYGVQSKPETKECCRYIHNDVQPPNGIVNNYYYNTQEGNMFNQTRSCEKCIHTKVCGMKDNVAKTTATVNQMFGATNPYVVIFVRCHHYDSGTVRRRSAGFD